MPCDPHIPKRIIYVIEMGKKGYRVRKNMPICWKKNGQVGDMKGVDCNGRDNRWDELQECRQTIGES